jgi:hypothetical protein
MTSRDLSCFLQEKVDPAGFPDAAPAFEAAKIQIKKFAEGFEFALFQDQADDFPTVGRTRQSAVDAPAHRRKYKIPEPIFRVCRAGRTIANNMERHRISGYPVLHLPFYDFAVFHFVFPV